MTLRKGYGVCVFINVPFDRAYQEFLGLLTFTILICDFFPRCAKEAYDSGQVRIDRIARIISECRFGVHDISRTELNPNGLPRFNMPFELGLFLGARLYGDGRQNKKVCLILDRDRFRYQEFLSDIGGQDIAAHDNSRRTLAKNVRDWLANNTKHELVGSSLIAKRYREFVRDLPKMCELHRRKPGDLTYNEYRRMAGAWISQRTRLAQP